MAGAMLTISLHILLSCRSRPSGATANAFPYYLMPVDLYTVHVHGAKCRLISVSGCSPQDWHFIFIPKIKKAPIPKSIRGY